MTPSRRRSTRSCRASKCSAEATEALIAGSAIRAPPAWLEVRHRRLLVALTAFAFFRGEPRNDIDSIFVATNLVLLGAAFIGLTFFGYFFDIFASVGFISLVFGLCRIYAGDPARPRGRQWRLPAGLRSGAGPLARGRAAAFRA